MNAELRSSADIEPLPPPPVRLAPEATPEPPPRRKRTPRLIAALAATALLGSGGWYLATAGSQSTDDAQVEGRVMNVAARVAGQVLRVRVRDNQLVNPGDVLVELDPADYAARVDAARADL